MNFVKMIFNLHLLFFQKVAAMLLQLFHFHILLDEYHPL